MLLEGFLVAFDEAYVCDESIILPFLASESPAGARRDAFNYFLSSYRIHIEQSLEILVVRWGICNIKPPIFFSLVPATMPISMAFSVSYPIILMVS